MEVDIKALNEKVQLESKFLETLLSEIQKVIVGQKTILERMLVGLLADGHILMEGVPGLAKTKTISTLAQAVNVKFQRIQFTPDLLPADLIGTMIYNQKTGDFVSKKGPIFTNFILADEINRAPAKVQSALLEAMQEKQVTIGSETYKLEDPFLVLATQNPVEQEGTYPLPEAQVDRFMLKLNIDYPKMDEELEIINRMTGESDIQINSVISGDQILNARKIVKSIYVDEKIKKYILNIVFATRKPQDFNLKDLDGLIEYGGSPRASINITMAAKAHAFLRGRGYVTPEDVKSIGMDVLRHRVIITYEAEAEDVTSEIIIQKIFDEIEVP